jgi:hypothetical protein
VLASIWINPNTWHVTVSGSLCGFTYNEFIRRNDGTRNHKTPDCCCNQFNRSVKHWNFPSHPTFIAWAALFRRVAF